MRRFCLSICTLLSFVSAAAGQSADLTGGSRLAEVACADCHQIDAKSPPPRHPSAAPRFDAIAKMPSTTELSIKVFLKTSHPHMPNIELSPADIDAVAAYILSLAKK